MTPRSGPNKTARAAVLHGSMSVSYTHLVAQGRYEMNGAVWVECDCNLVGGEALIRQFLWGQRLSLIHI